MGFMPEDKTSKSPSRRDYQLAGRLHDALVKKGHRRGWSHRDWANEFRILRNQVGSADTVQKVLDWYSKHLGEDRVPIAASAKSFRLKFANIEASAKINLRDNPDVVVSPAAKDLGLRLRRTNHWPEAAKTKLDITIQISMNNLAAYLNKLAKKWNTIKPPVLDSDSILIQGFIMKIKSQIGYGSFVEKWMEQVQERITWKGKWKGNILNWAFTEDHKMFEEMGLGWASEYTGGHEYWLQFKEAIK